MAKEIQVLSAGAVQPGLSKVIEAFQLEAGLSAKINFSTAPALEKRISAAEPFDIVIAPPELLDRLRKTGQVSNRAIVLGRIGVGVMVRQGTPLPNIASVDGLKQSLLDSESLVYNQASTGLYIDNLFKRLGIAVQSESKITRCADFAAVRDHISKGRGNAIGFGATTVIIESIDKGVIFAGPLPAEIQNYTTYAAALISSADSNAVKFMDFLAAPLGKLILRSVGIV